MLPLAVWVAETARKTQKNKGAQIFAVGLLLNLGKSKSWAEFGWLKKKKLNEKPKAILQHKGSISSIKGYGTHHVSSGWYSDGMTL